jgi:hypothetical protein
MKTKLCDLPDAFPVGGLTVAQLRQVVVDAIIENERRVNTEKISSAQGMSAADAARLAKKRRGDVLLALKTGALVGTRRGAHWSTCSESVKTWILRGCPTDLAKAG